jgi:hypothetical protein
MMATVGICIITRSSRTIAFGLEVSHSRVETQPSSLSNFHSSIKPTDSISRDQCNEEES